MSEAEPRRRPQQERSKTRVESILDVALELVVEQGAEALAMRELARRAGVQISSVYQYFPSKAAILRELAKRNLERVRLKLENEVGELFAEHDGRPTPAQAVHRVVDAYYAHYRDQPAAVAVWAGAQSDHSLRELDIEDTQLTARFLVPSLMEILSLTDAEDVFALALLLAETTGAVARLALAVEPPLRDQLVAQLKRMLIATLEAAQAGGVEAGGAQR
ncbi:TetR family transcriptional regulator [Aquabacterium sp.]|uniref:TetR family transcriptional regulator n=1 Tax=Aquabacterium sp. TaxID=1872578 RepID=UPI00378392A9